MLHLKTEIQRGIRRQGKELSKTDVGRVIDFYFGRVLSIDVGKRIWLKDFGIVMESEEQRDKRKAIKEDEE